MAKTSAVPEQNVTRSVKRSKRRDGSVSAKRTKNIAHDRADWIVPMPQPWPKIKGWNNDQIVKATLEYEAMVKEIAQIKMPRFSAVDMIREDRSKNDWR